MTKHLTIHTESLPKKHPKLEDMDLPEKSFERLQTLYIKDCLSQQILSYLKFLVRNKKIPPEYKSLPLLNLLEDCCKDFLINDLELVMWGIFLDAIWTEKTKNLRILLLYTAYAAKRNMNLEEDLFALNSFIKIKYAGFQAGYTAWHSRNSTKLSVSLRDFNKSFKLYLSLPIKDVIDYNYYVDELLHIAPPAGVCEKELKLEFEVEIEQEETKLPELLTMNSLFAGNEPPLPMLFDNWKSIDGGDFDFEGSESPLKGFVDEGGVVR